MKQNLLYSTLCFTLILISIGCFEDKEQEVQPTFNLKPLWTDDLLQEIRSTGQDSLDSDIIKTICDLPLSILKTPRLLSIAAIRDEDMSRSFAQIMIEPVQLCDTNYNFLAVDDQLDTLFKRTFFAAALTLPTNPKKLIPLAQSLLDDIAIVHLGKAKRPAFDRRINSYSATAQSTLIPHSELFSAEAYFKKKVVILTLNERIAYPKFYKELKILHEKTNLIIVNFGDLMTLKNLSKDYTIVQNYEDNNINEDFSAQLIFGAIQAKGQLPTFVTEGFHYGQGDHQTPIIRLQYGLPEDVGIDGEELTKNIDAIAERAIRKKATPGCRVLIAKSGNIIFNKSYGYQTYDKKRPVEEKDLYDLASITKVAATTLALMRLYEQGKIESFEDYLEKYFGTKTQQGNRSRIHNIRLRNFLTHRSGLPISPPLPQYVRIKDTTSQVYHQYFSTYAHDNYSVKITEGLFLNKNIQNQLWEEIQQTRPSGKRSFEYSDVNFLILQKLVEQLAKQPLDVFVKKEFYSPLLLNTMTFKPLQFFKKDKIAPTEWDKKWRFQQLQGEVQDEAAAFFGGVGGNAGLFSDAEDLAVLCQMLLNDGKYGGIQLLKPETIALFTTPQYGNHRGLGFDVKTKKGGIGCYYGAGKGTFGHSGFTGTCFWVDKENELVYIFLSNRIFNDKDNQGLMKYKTRELIHRAIYKTM